MFNAQEPLLSPSKHRRHRRAILEELRERVPERFLAHYLRLIVQGRRGVALVRHGTCSQCHIRVPASVLPALVTVHDALTCEHCGSYLLLPEDEMASVPFRRAPAKPAQPVAVGGR